MDKISRFSVVCNNGAGDILYRGIRAATMAHATMPFSKDDPWASATPLLSQSALVTVRSP